MPFELAPGTLGVNTAPVVKGVPLVLRPPATGVELDFSRLKDAPLDDWYSFHIEGRHVGFERSILGLKDGRLELTREVAPCSRFGSAGASPSDPGGASHTASQRSPSFRRSSS